MHRLVESTFDVRIPVVKLLQYPTIRLLAANLVTIHQDPIQRKSEDLRLDEVVECTPLGYALRFPGIQGKTATLLRERGGAE